MFEKIDHERCLQYLHVGFPLVITVIIAISTIMIWIWWDDWKMKKEDALYLQTVAPEPTEVEEIPHGYLHFQKLATRIANHDVTDHEPLEDLLDQVLEWMMSRSHKNTLDLETVWNVFVNENSTTREQQQASRWFESAFRIWSTHPKWIMPAWMFSLQRTRSQTFS
jgi:hypothetical protein